MSSGSEMRTLIVNADDFGLSEGVNRGVAVAHEQGIVTSASLMVRRRAAPEAASYARRHPELSVGLHLDLGEWIYAKEAWHVAIPPPPSAEVAIEEQLNVFRTMMGRDPTHLDSHQHVHREPPVNAIAIAAADRLGIPLRSHSKHIRYRGDFYGQTAKADSVSYFITVEALLRVLGSLDADLNELACHPAAEVDFDSQYSGERLIELNTLCDDRVRRFLCEAGVELRSFADVDYARRVTNPVSKPAHPGARPSPAPDS